MKIDKEIFLNGSEERINKLGLYNKSPEDIKILVVDNDKWMARILAKFISNFGFTPVIVTSPHQCVAEAVKHKPLLIILDFILPEIDGITVLKILKKINSVKDIPVLIISAKIEEKALAEAFLEGAAAFVSKPIKKNVLLKKIEECLGFNIFQVMQINKKMEDELLSVFD